MNVAKIIFLRYIYQCVRVNIHNKIDFLFMFILARVFTYIYIHTNFNPVIIVQ